MRFSRTEIQDLIVSIVVLAIIFSRFQPGLFLETLFIIVVVFVLHELSHKYLAQKYGFEAEYKIWFFGLMLGILTALVSGGALVFAAPGAVFINPVARRGFAFTVAKLSQKQYGKISLAGPLVNIAIGIAFVLLNFSYPSNILLRTAGISFFLGFFNLFPVAPLDGSKIIAWNKTVWITATAAAFAGFILIGFL